MCTDGWRGIRLAVFWPLGLDQGGDNSGALQGKPCPKDLSYYTWLVELVVASPLECATRYAWQLYLVIWFTLCDTAALNTFSGFWSAAFCRSIVVFLQIMTG